MTDPVDLALEALARLVRVEYAPGHSLAHICDIWGREPGLTDEHVAALRTVEEAHPSLGIPPGKGA